MSVAIIPGIILCVFFESIPGVILCVFFVFQWLFQTPNHGDGKLL